MAQVVAQALAPPAMLGAAAASVQLSRSVGSAAGVTLVVGALFAILSQDGAAAAVFADMVRHGPAVLEALPDAARTTTAARIDAGFSFAFMAVAAFAAINALLAWTLPLRRSRVAPELKSG
ncbi:hypothetical protein ACFQU7_30900 [Pseudoroseomonas wenyumeiae]